MSTKYSQKTSISLYRFDSEDDYRSWLVANTSRINTDFHDIMAVVKNPNMYNGYDLFINGHSLTKSVMYIKKGDELVEVSSSSNCFSPDKQYLLKNFTRKGQGQKNVIVLEEFDVAEIVTTNTWKFVETNEQFHNWVDERIKDYVYQFMAEDIDRRIAIAVAEYMQPHKITHENIESILTDSHNTFRKIFSVLHNRRRPNLKIEPKFIDNYGKVRSNLGLYINVAVINKLKFNISNYEGLDITYKSLKAYKNDETECFWELEGKKIRNGENPEFDFFLSIENDTKIRLVLEYSNRYIDDEWLENEKNFDKEVVYSTEDAITENTTTFYIEPEPSESLPKSYVVYIPMVENEDGELELDSRYKNIPNLETVNWMMNNAVAKLDGQKSFLLDSESNILTFNDNSRLLTKDSFYGEYLLPDENIYSLIYSIDSNPDIKELRVPSEYTKGYQIYSIVPSVYTSVKFDGDDVEEINRGTYESVTYSLYKNEYGSFGETKVELEIKY